MHKRALGNLPPIGVELRLSARQGVGQKLQDVFLGDLVAVVAGDAAARCAADRTVRRLGEIVAQSLEGGLAHQAAVGQARIGDLGIDHGLHQGRLRLVDRRVSSERPWM
jgi:hypothetical protein